MKILIVEEKYNEKKLNSFLFDKFNSLSNNTFYKALRKKDIRINDVKINDNVTLHTGDEIKIFIVDDLLFNSAKPKIDIVYEDDNILIINKPAGLEVTGNESLKALIEKSYNYQFLEPCHRLDRNTTGLTLFAKNESSLNELLNLFKNKQIEKHYRTIVIRYSEKKISIFNCIFI